MLKPPAPPLAITRIDATRLHTAHSKTPPAFGTGAFWYFGGGSAMVEIVEPLDWPRFSARREQQAVPHKFQVAQRDGLLQSASRLGRRGETADQRVRTTVTQTARFWRK